MSARTLKNHKENTYLIGMFEIGYGYNEDFTPDDLTDGPEYTLEFERKISNSESAVKLYESTWRKLDKYIKSGEHEKFTRQIDNQLQMQL